MGKSVLSDQKCGNLFWLAYVNPQTGTLYKNLVMESMQLWRRFCPLKGFSYSKKLH
jgi:hypothetical protein